MPLCLLSFRATQPFAVWELEGCLAREAARLEQVGCLLCGHGRAFLCTVQHSMAKRPRSMCLRDSTQRDSCDETVGLRSCALCACSTCPQECHLPLGPSSATHIQLVCNSFPTLNGLQPQTTERAAVEQREKVETFRSARGEQPAASVVQCFWKLNWFGRTHTRGAQGARGRAVPPTLVIVLL